MANVTYRPADVLHWFGTGSREAKTSARRKGRDLARTVGEADVVAGLKAAAGAAADLGRGALTDLAHRQAEETTFVLGDTHFEAHTLTRHRRFAYADVTEITARTSDRFDLAIGSARLTVRPVAHLVAGRLRVPIGWIRNGMEVHYAMLIEELSARTGVEIAPA